MSRLIFSELGTTPSDTDSGASQIYVKDDGKLYIKGGTGAEETVMKWTSGGSASINYTAGNVGIGTTTPSQKLDVQGTIVANNELHLASAATRLISTGGDIRFDLGSAEKIRFKADGKVGIGTTTPEGLLHIKHATNSTDLSANHIFGLSTGNITISATPIAKAWAQFSGTDTSNIRQSYNVSSITDNSTGQYYVNFATDINDGSAQNDNYCVVATAGDNTPFTNQDFYVTASSDSTSRCYVTCWSIYHFHHVDNSANTDPDKVNIVVYSR